MIQVSNCKQHPMVAVLLAVFIGLLLPAVSQASPITQLKVLSFNIWKQGELGLSNCIEVIRTTGADIVGLQECNEITAKTIAAGLGFYVLPAQDCPIISRYPILSSPINTKHGVGATIQLSPNQRVHLFNCHLEPSPYGPNDLMSGQSVPYIINQENSRRMPALNQILNVMRPFLDSFEPCFLVGKFNAPSHQDYVNVPWPTSIAPANAGLDDSYRELNSSNRMFTGPGMTLTPKPNQESKGVFNRVDFIHYSQGDGVTPTNSIELDEQNSINPWPSKHRAVLTTFSLVPPKPQPKASLPSPANLATNILQNPTLTWLSESNTINHAVYFGPSITPILLEKTTNTFAALTNLLPATTYFWRVDELTPSGTITGDLWSFVTKPTSTAMYEWNFANLNLVPAFGNGIFTYADGATTSIFTVLDTTDGKTIPHIGGTPSQYLKAPAFSGIRNGYTITFNSPPNGGGAYINQYTIIFDVLLPGPINWFPFFNTNTRNDNDADFYVSPEGAIGIGDIGYSANGLIKENTWYRIAFAADLANSTVTYYLNGAPVFTGKADLDGRFSIYSNTDPGADLLLFNEGDNSAVFTHVVYLSSFFFTDRTMSASEIAMLGGPKARGVYLSSFFFTDRIAHGVMVPVPPLHPSFYYTNCWPIKFQLRFEYVAELKFNICSLFLE